MLRLACETGPVNDVADRIEAAARALTALGPDVEAREPWPLSAAFGEEPEADWGPKELLAHIAEMIPYWLAEIEEIVTKGQPTDGPTDGAATALGAAVPFGRVAADPERIGRIGRDRVLPAGVLLERIGLAATAAATRLRTLSPGEAACRGLHSRLGAMTIAAIAERFVAGHIVDHEAQLRAILARAAADNGSRAGAQGRDAAST